MDSLTCVFGTNTGQQHKIIFKVANLKIEQNTIYIYIFEKIFKEKINHLYKEKKEVTKMVEFCGKIIMLKFVVFHVTMSLKMS